MHRQNTILIADDMEINRAVLQQLFEDRYNILEAENGCQALALIREHAQSIAVVLLDIMMPELDGFGVLQAMRDGGYLRQIPVVLITGDSSLDAANRGYDYGVADLITKPFEVAIVRHRVENIIDLYRHKNKLEYLVKVQTRKIEGQKRKLKEYDNFLIDTLSTVVEFRDLESGQHIQRIRSFTRILLQYLANRDNGLHLTTEKIDMIASASALHDIGKIAIPDAILLKPGRLTPEEFEIMKTHSIKGCEILDSMLYIHDKEYMRYSYDICRSHHERWDGRGYPDGLEGDKIPLAAQVVALADVYDALVSERVYKAAYSTDEAMGMILGGECGAFSPYLLECLKLAGKEMAFMVHSSTQVGTAKEIGNG